ncbi:DUF2264 domain-containing protein [Sphingobium yanoikuyae]|uniref:DUF2264 domain-containing protein n=1 Tax=Sphingobium yanoikuyae TaxID=13690 RepID=UPI0026EF4D61|nr:DUF2264 domain-containing protein [Sphingobium yanoikuyae]
MQDNLSDHEAFLAYAETLARPILFAAKGPGLVTGMPVEHSDGAGQERAQYSPLEAVGRLLCGLAPLLELQHRTGGDGVIALPDIHHLLDVISDPSSPQRLNFTSGSQPLVDAAFLAQSIIRAPNALWAALSVETQANLAACLRDTRQIMPHYNNWLLFSAMIEAALCRMGHDWDAMRVDYALRQCETWYVGDGLYADGPRYKFDYYNSYVIQPMMRDILDVVGATCKDWTALQIKAGKRIGRLAVILERLIAADGSFPPIGRSIVYRCAAFQPLAQLALEEALPALLAPGQVRAALRAVIDRTLRAPENFDADGWLRIGLNGSQPALGEAYISTGSLYLCSTALLPLGLPANAAFWADPALPWTQQRIWEMGENVARDKGVG